MQAIFWRKEGTERWFPEYVPLAEDGSELYLIHPAIRNSVCTSCGKSLRNILYVLSTQSPRSAETDLRYCIEHSPIPIEVSMFGTKIEEEDEDDDTEN
jgi:hypothetical protein